MRRVNPFRRRRQIAFARLAVATLVFAVLLFAPCFARAADPVTTAKIKARAALSLAIELDSDGDEIPSTMVAIAKSRASQALKMTAGEGCDGRCRPDYAAALEEVRTTGKPMVVFVGGCEGAAKGLPSEWVCVRLDSYGSSADSNEPRIMILLRGNGHPATPDTKEVYVRQVMPKTSTTDEINIAVTAMIATPKQMASPVVSVTVPSWSIVQNQSPTRAVTQLLPVCRT